MTDTKWGVLLDDRAAMVLNAYPPEDQSCIRSSLGQLIGPGAIERLGRRIHELAGEKLLYSLRVPGDIRVIFARRGDTIIVVDILRREMLARFASASSSANSIGKPNSDPDEAERRVPIATFAPEPFAVIRGFNVVVQPAEDSFVATLQDANISSSGETEEEAVANIKDLILMIFQGFEHEDDSELGPAMIRQKHVLQSLIRRK